MLYVCNLFLCLEIIYFSFVCLCFYFLLLETIHRERQTRPQWHYEAKKTKGKNDHVYIIHDPEDHTIANDISNFLKDNKFRVK